MAMSVTPILPNKQTLKLIGGGSSFLRNSFSMKGSSAKRKSAVELLQESKAYYVKSEKVLDSKQEFKHSEHLQVSANPNFDKLHVKVPANLRTTTTSNTSTTPSSSSSMTIGSEITKQTPPPPPPRRNDAKMRAFEQKLFGSNNNDVHCQTCVAPAAPVHQQQFCSVRNSSLLHQPQPPLPLKSPHLSRPRSKTQPESAFVSKGEFRKSHPERDCFTNDIQMKLRRLLNTDSKENLNGSLYALDLVNGNHHCSDNNKLSDASSPQKNSTSSSEVNHQVFHMNGDPILQPRHQQDGNYSIHKSMPDLSPTKLGISRGTRGRPRTTCSNCTSSTSDSDSNPSGSMSVTAPKSSDMQHAHSRTTSDYVSCSPSCNCDHFSGSGKNKLSFRSQKEQQNSVDPLLITAKKSGHPYFPLSPKSLTPLVKDSFAVDSCVSPSVKRRPILRSKSDISHRFSRSTTNEFIDTGSPNKISCQNSSDLERFFNCMGLDSSVLKVLGSPPSNSSSPVFFSSTSSVDSSHCENYSNSNGSDGSAPNALARSGPASIAERDVNSRFLPPGITNRDLVHHGPVETSIVERNARVIKWLYNCRKVNKTDGNS